MPRVVAAHLLLAATALMPMPARGAGPWSLHKAPRGIRAIADGRAETPEGTVAAVLRVHCKNGGPAPLCVSVKVEDAAKIEAFDFAAFEGGGAANGQRLLQARAGDVAVEAALVGAWVRDPEGAFAFELCGSAASESDAAALARAIARGVGAVELTVRHPADDTRAIRAQFPADAEDRVVIEVVERCARH